MAKPHQRVMALLLAVLFLATSVAAGLAVLWQINQDNKNNAALTAPASNGIAGENALQGTKLEGFEPVENIAELEKQDIQEGTGEEVKAGATVTAHYTGALAKDGTIFQSSHDMGQPIEFPLDSVIKGWTDGVPGMKVGGKRRILIPAAQAYGEQSPSPDIPANSDLVFDIEITAVKNP